jgi:hypothetical protein
MLLCVLWPTTTGAGGNLLAFGTGMRHGIHEK